jgi:glycosyltransferase involved in cell wall biosynthesis
LSLFSRLRRFLKLYLSSLSSVVISFYEIRRFFSILCRNPQSDTAIQRFSAPAILFIDSDIPRIDRDAGAVSVGQFMTLFASHGWRVYLWTLDQADPSPIKRHFAERNINVISPSKALSLKSWIKRNASSFRVIFLNRPALSAALLTILPQGSHKIAYYGHDLHSQRFTAEAQQTGRGESRLLAQRFKSLEQRIAKSVDFCYYPSADEVAEMNTLSAASNAKVLPPYYFDFDELHTPVPPKGADFLFVGNFNHLPNVDAALWLVQEIWPCIKQRVNVPLHLTIAGSSPPKSILDLIKKNDDVEVTGWISEQKLSDLYMANRIAIIPLRYGAGVKHKVVSAVIRGCPVVTTEIGLQGLGELKGSVGLANQPDQIAAECYQLIMSDELWSFRVGSARRALANRFTEASMWQALRDLHSET